MMDVNESYRDFVLPFQLESGGVRGRVVRICAAMDDIFRKRAYPQEIAKTMCEFTAVAAAMGTALKFDGIFTLQAKGDGAVSLIVADVTADGGIRCCAKYDAAKLSGAGENLLGNGHLLMTADANTGGERYQGVVKLEGESVSSAVQHYFRQSEQIPTAIMCAAREYEGAWVAGCLMLQRMPSEGGVAVDDTSAEDSWHRAMTFMATCTDGELSSRDLESEALLYRLFNEEGVRVFDKIPLRHQCRCSEERILSLLRSMSQADIEEMTINGKIIVTCEFCGAEYGVDKAYLAVGSA